MPVRLEVPDWNCCRREPSAVRSCMPPLSRRRRWPQCPYLRTSESVRSWLSALGRQWAAPYDNRLLLSRRMVDRVCEAIPESQPELKVVRTWMEYVVAGVNGAESDGHPHHPS